MIGPERCFLPNVVSNFAPMTKMCPSIEHSADSSKVEIHVYVLSKKLERSKPTHFAAVVFFWIFNCYLVIFWKFGVYFDRQKIDWQSAELFPQEVARAAPLTSSPERGLIESTSSSCTLLDSFSPSPSPSSATCAYSTRWKEPNQDHQSEMTPR